MFIALKIVYTIIKHRNICMAGLSSQAGATDVDNDNLNLNTEMEGNSKVNELLFMMSFELLP